MSFPQDEKRERFYYNETPFEMTGPGVYKSHPDMLYLEGRKLEDVYESGFYKTFNERFLAEKAQVLKDRLTGGR
jgi:hypothetical protein